MKRSPLVFARFSLLVLFSLLVVSPAYAGKKNKKKKKDEETTETKKKDDDGIKPIKDVTKKCISYDGLFTIYQDTTNGTTYMAISESQLDEEFIYFSYVENGVLDAGHNKGSYRRAKIFSIEKEYEKIRFVGENTSYYYDPENALSKAANANINKPVLVSEAIVGMDKDSSGTVYLIKGDGIFLTEAMQQVIWSPNPKAKNPYKPGKLSKDKTIYRDINSYPENTDIVVEYVYENDYPQNYGSQAVTDARYTSVMMQHSFIQVPDNNFQPRYEDPRLGYFTTQVTDMTSPDATPYMDMISRWHLEKKDPESALSEPVEPIVYWIENTTPVEWRDAIKEAVESWNLAFEQAGFLNAVQVKVQPDDAEWDAGDIRYNVIRWTSSPQPPFGGYGPSFVNPRTGQILGADIMIEYVYITNRMKQAELFSEAGLPLYEDYDEQFINPDDIGYYCDFGHFHQQSIQFGMNVLKASGMTTEDEEEFLEQSVYRLMLHEVGHTLGLTHNFKGSTFHSPEELANKELTMETGLTGSVMEYPATNIPLNKEDRGHYFDTKPGPYDMWVIEYGYSPALSDPEAEAARLDEIASRSNEPGLAYANDADDMRSDGRGIDPNAMIFDLSSDPITYSIDRIELVNSLYPTIMDKYVTEGDNYQELRNAYFSLTGNYGSAVWVLTRQIGGVYVDRSVEGQPGATQPFAPVPAETQKKAMNALSQYAFAPKAFEAANGLYEYLQKQRRGFNNYRSGNEDPQIHDRILRIQQSAFNHLLNANVLTRMTDSELYGNEYGVAEMMDDLTSAVFAEDLYGNVNSFRQNVQQEYVDRLIKVIDGSAYGHIAQSNALYQLTRIQGLLKGAKSYNTATKAHRSMLNFKIEEVLEP